MTDTEYQGWTNRETWLVALWLNNEQGLQEAAQAASNTGDEMLQEAATSLEELVDDLIDSQLGDKRTGFVADMLSDSLASVNWGEVAQSFRDMRAVEAGQ